MKHTHRLCTLLFFCLVCHGITMSKSAVTAASKKQTQARPVLADAIDLTLIDEDSDVQRQDATWWFCEPSLCDEKIGEKYANMDVASKAAHLKKLRAEAASNRSTDDDQRKRDELLRQVKTRPPTLWQARPSSK